VFLPERDYSKIIATRRLPSGTHHLFHPMPLCIHPSASDEQYDSTRESIARDGRSSAVLPVTSTRASGPPRHLYFMQATPIILYLILKTIIILTRPVLIRSTPHPGVESRQTPNLCLWSKGDSPYLICSLSLSSSRDACMLYHPGC
jgi:hypothetical protein